jgi:pimeloyl-ACP methyl ester carboxylesterase
MGKQGFRFRGESQILDAEARLSAPGQFVKLSGGMVHYEIAGPSNAQTVILVPGFSVPYYVWDPTFKGLVEAGYRVVRYDLYGRGYSDRPEGVYNQGMFDQQLVELLSALEIEDAVDMIGLSMGGAIAVVFVDRHPELVRRLCLISPAGLPMERSLTARLVEIPVLGELVMSLWGSQVLISGLRDDFHEEDGMESYLEKYREQMEYRGFKRALLSTLRSGVLAGTAEAYERVGRQKRAVMLIWGRRDRVVPFEMNERVRGLMGNVEFHIVDNAGHISHYECPEVVNSLLVGFLAR